MAKQAIADAKRRDMFFKDGDRLEVVKGLAAPLQQAVHKGTGLRAQASLF